MRDRCELVLRKVERANKHIHDFNIAARGFLRDKVDGLRFEDDPNTGDRTYYLTELPPIPAEVGLIAGDALQNLRSALDHLIWQLVLANGKVPTRSNSFPVADSSAKYIAALGNGKVKGVRKDAIDAIDAIKPYKGGDDQIWHIHALNNVDKHRLMLTTCLTVPARSLMPSETSKLEALFRACHPGEPVPNLRGGFLNIPNPISLKAGYPLLTVPKADLKEDVKFIVHVAFNEPGIIRPQPVIHALQAMAHHVYDIIIGFDRFL